MVSNAVLSALLNQAITKTRALQQSAGSVVCCTCQIGVFQAQSRFYPILFPPNSGRFSPDCGIMLPPAYRGARHDSARPSSPMEE